jgi:hypothetical protein
MAFEVTREMRLVVETDVRRHTCYRLTLEEAPSRGIDATRQEISVRSDTERACEAPHQMRG